MTTNDNFFANFWIELSNFITSRKMLQEEKIEILKNGFRLNQEDKITYLREKDIRLKMKA